MDANPPWVRSLFSAMPSGVEVEWFCPTALSTAMRSGVRSFLASRRQVGERVVERRFAYPGWGRFPKWSARVAVQRVRQAIGACNAGTTIVYTLPYYSDVAARLIKTPAVYFAYDPYASYEGWDAAEVERREAALLARCRAVFAISPVLAEDFKARTSLPVFVQPNGISEDRLAACQRRGPRPDDLPTCGRTACCIGQIGSAYDWQLLADVTARCGDFTFVFIGPRHAMTAECEQAANEVFSRGNVVWLGAKRPEELAAYMMHADVLFSPLALTPANHRRSLLRIYDYLATDRPIVATPVDSALEHAEFLTPAATGEAFTAALKSAISGGAADLSARHAYLAQHTWPRRAETFLTNLARATALVS